MTDRGRPTPRIYAEESSPRFSSTFDATRLPWQVTGESQIPLSTKTRKLSDTEVRVCSVGSAVGTNTTLKDAYNSLTAAERVRAEARVNQIADAFLQGDLRPIRAGLFRGNNGHPDIHDIDLGRRDDPNSVHIYYMQVHTPQETFLLISACRTRQTGRVVGIFPGYKQVRS